MKLTYLKDGAGINDLHDAIASSSPGDGVVYFRGETVTTKAGGQIDIAHHARAMYQRGSVLLVQKVTGKVTGPASNPRRIFDYIAVKRKCQS